MGDYFSRFAKLLVIINFESAQDFFKKISKL